MMPHTTTLTFAFFLSLLTALLMARAQEPASDLDASAGEKPPFAYVQILNGISPHKITLSINEQPLYPGIGPGARISSFGVPDQEWTLGISKDGSEATKKLTLRFPRPGFFTVVLTGDFAELPPIVAPDGSKQPDYRVKASFLGNKKPQGQKVDVRIVNGMSEGNVSLMREKKEQCSAAPGETATAADQPADLYMEASHQGMVMPLYIAQEPPASNITVVFYESAGASVFRAMTERTSAEAVP